ncbi:MAG: sigma-54-dependent Fis family transcriptional regulator [Bacteroidia bacterium]|nr:sigma-54 dependent transcriptional regulator [Bacteroidia bacterium]MCC6768859.1 sigma-54-dependent Fis family transcriptional regulator [Bacteroidia bacterium]
MNIQDIKNRFGIIGNSPMLDRALDTAWRVAATDLSVLITGESGTGKEVFSKVIHHYSSRKHGSFIAVNCGAIPEGTIDSELFGHEKGSFTGANEARKGYFEVAGGGTIFLDEVAELPLQTQVRLLRVLETGEFIKVGSSKVQKTDVRIVAATNVNIPEAIEKGKFREDLYYRLNTVPVHIPSLRDRGDDIQLLFRKFAADFAERYKMPSVKLAPDAQQLLLSYRWPGNVRQLKNVTEQISIIENERLIGAAILANYLPGQNGSMLPSLVKQESPADFSERELLYKVLFDMRKDMVELKKLMIELLQHPGGEISFSDQSHQTINRLYSEVAQPGYYQPVQVTSETPIQPYNTQVQPVITEHEEVAEESLSLDEREKELIIKALEKCRGRRKNAAKELGISERTLYRKIKEYGIDL